MQQERHLSKVSLEPHAGRNRPGGWGRKDEEYIADFTLVARRTLTEEEHRLFRYHFLLGADWKLCSRKLGMDRGNFFHAVYRIEQKLGKTFRELEPYPLFPLDDYFHGPSRIGPPATKASKVDVIPLWAGPLRFPTIGRAAKGAWHRTATHNDSLLPTAATRCNSARIRPRPGGWC
ncbi:MAG: hypothetical protein ABI824_12145 [Acidobacteriota bacterium]